MQQTARPAARDDRQAPAAPAAGDAVRSLFLLPYYPPLLVALLTLLPLLMMEGRLPGTMGLAHEQGREPGLYMYGVACVLGFWMGFRRAFRARPPDAAGRARAVAAAWPLHTRGRTAAVVALGIAGLIAVGLLVVYLVVRGGAAERIAVMVASGTSDPELREEIIGSESVPGIVRMLNYLVPAALVLTLACALARVRLPRGLFPLLLLASLGALGVRSLVFMDRQPIFMGVLLSAAVVLERIRWTTARLVAAGVGIVGLGTGLLFLASILATLRGGEQVDQNTILHYADLGVANTIVAMRTTTTFALGGNSVWTPLTFVPRGIGLGDLPLPSTDSQWVWNPAANLLCHTYQDFGPFGIVTYLLLGTAAGAVCARRVTHPASLTWAIAYLWCMLALLGIWTVPLTRGTEFWCALLAATTVAVLADRVGAGRTRRAGGSSPFLAAPPSPAPLP